MRYDAQAAALPRHFALYDLQGPQGALAAWCGDALPPFPEGPNRRCTAGARSLCHLGPNRWLLRAPLDEEAALAAALRPEAAPPEVSLVRVSDTLAWTGIAGPEAAELLSIGCPLDLHADAFPPDGATWTELYRLRALILRAPGGFELAVERSYAAFVADCLARAQG